MTNDENPGSLWRTMISSRYYGRASEQHNASGLNWDRQYLPVDNWVNRRLQVNPAYIDRLEQEAVLTGHSGCVNCLEWSSSGRLLASGSDDCQVMIWDPFRKRRVHTITTEHLGNMFSVKFLPQHNDSIVATGAADKYIYVYDINHNNDTVFACHCHAMRVKRLATAPDSPFIFWSAGEDGKILQLDMREQHRCRSEETRTRIINLTTYLDSSAEAKCLAINPRRTEYLAVGSNDPYARIYDRRMLRPYASFIETDEPQMQQQDSTTDTTETFGKIPKNCVTYYCPGHIKKNNTREIQHESRAITYLTFNAAGTELLVNMGCEHVYLYDLLSDEQPIYLNLPEYIPPTPLPPSTAADTAADSVAASGSGSSDGTESGVSAGSPPKRRKLPEHIEIQKKFGNDYLENEKYLRAIEQYSEAIATWPDCAVLYLNRATAYMRRQWFGDVYAALRDCHQALRLEPGYIKAHFRLARALLDLGRPQDADECLKVLVQRFPSYATNHGVLMLHKDIRENRRTSATASTSSAPNTLPPTAAQALSSMDGYSFKLSDEEFEWRSQSRDYAKRFVGHCNTTTDIKEANFIGHDGNFIAAGSDDGNFFIWERKSCKIRAVYRGDGAIVNCVQPHPDICMIATSGIDHDVKIWSPIASSATERPNVVSHFDKCVEDNQQKMKTDPFDLNTRNAYCWNG